MANKTSPQKVECLNPNTGGHMNIDKNIYDLFSKAILENTPVPTALEDAVNNMKVIEAIFKSSEIGSWNTLDA